MTAHCMERLVFSFRPLNAIYSLSNCVVFIPVSQSIADIHGFAGAIVHGDIHPVQWLRTRDGKLKLNDFNNAEILDWSRERNDYCQADRGTWGGMVNTGHPRFSLDWLTLFIESHSLSLCVCSTAPRKSFSGNRLTTKLMFTAWGTTFIPC